LNPFTAFIRSVGWCLAGYAVGALLFWCGYAVHYGGSWSIWLILFFWLPVVLFWSIAVSLLRLWRPHWVRIPSLLSFGVAVAFLPLLGFWPTYFFRVGFALFNFSADAVFLALILFLVYWISRVASHRSNQSLEPTAGSRDDQI
jgi:glucan phosphoethanolaminetransferase (alkaline phosphatase superfamily)